MNKENFEMGEKITKNILFTNIYFFHRGAWSKYHQLMMTKRMWACSSKKENYKKIIHFYVNIFYFSQRMMGDIMRISKRFYIICYFSHIILMTKGMRWGKYKILIYILNRGAWLKCHQLMMTKKMWGS